LWKLLEKGGGVVCILFCHGSGANDYPLLWVWWNSSKSGFSENEKET